MFRLSIAKEKVFKRGSILNASLILNLALNDISKSDVEYTIDGKKYQHSFSNNGSYIGFKLAYFLKPI